MSATSNAYTQLTEETDATSEKELMIILIDNYTNLQRIKFATDKDKEIAYQLKVAEVKLETFGIDAKKLNLC